MTTIDAATKTILVPGSVWTRETKNGNKDVTVLFITNQGLPPETLAKCPQQVVFLNDEGAVLSMKPEQFVAKRNFSTMNPEAEVILRHIVEGFDDEDEEGDDEIDLDSIQLPESSEGDADVSLETEPVAENFETTGNLLAVQAQQQAQMNNTSPVLQLQDGLNAALVHLLTSRFVSYSESVAPNGTGDTLHTMRFALSPELDLDMLNKAFGLEGPITKFTINSAVAPTTVDIDGFFQVWLEVVAPMGKFPSQSYGLVQLTSRGDFREQQVVQQKPQPAAAPVAADPMETPSGLYQAPEVEAETADEQAVAKAAPAHSSFISDATIVGQKPTPPAAEPTINLAAIPTETPAAPQMPGLNIVNT